MAEPEVKEDEEELIPVDTPPVEQTDEEKAAALAATEDDDDDGEDERLAEDHSEDDAGADKESAAHKKRVKQREIRKRAKDRTLAELAALRQENAAFRERMAALEGNALNHNELAIDRDIAQAENERKQAETVMARAIEEGNGTDVVAAQEFRDAARDRLARLKDAKAQVGDARKTTTQTQGDPQVANFANQWMKENPWFDPNGSNEVSAVTKVIDAEVAREGFNPATPDYWLELTARVNARYGQKEAPAAAAATADTGARRGPPVGKTSEHAPQSTRKEIYVTPERKAAMIEAGTWDDPVLRTRMLKRYQAYDQASR